MNGTQVELVDLGDASEQTKGWGFPALEGHPTLPTRWPAQ